MQFVIFVLFLQIICHYHWRYWCCWFCGVHEISTVLQCASCRRRVRGINGVLPSEARRADTWGGVLREEAASPLPTSKGVGGSAVSSGPGVEPRPINNFSVLWGLLMLLRVNSCRSLSICQQGGLLHPLGARNYMSRGVISCSMGV